MADELLKKTPLYETHLSLKARMVPFAGYSMPVSYTGLLDESLAVRSRAGLFDVSHMGQFRVEGKDAFEALQKMVTNDLSKIKIGQAQYNILCTEEGGTIDDLIVYWKSDNEFYLCVNASNREEDFCWFQERLPKTVSLRDESDQTALLALQGPLAPTILSELTQTDVKTLKYFWSLDMQVAGIHCFVARTGYTGEDGFELYVPSDQGATLWNALMENGKGHGLVAAGLGARDTLRTEMGYPLHGHELSKTISPLTANLNWVVKLDKTIPFIGMSALRAEKEKGTASVLKGFIVEDKRLARPDYPVLSSTTHEKIGYISSGTQSPHLNVPIALGFIGRAHKDDPNFLVDIRGQHIPLTPKKLPFVPAKTLK